MTTETRRGHCHPSVRLGDQLLKQVPSLKSIIIYFDRSLFQGDRAGLLLESLVSGHTYTPVRLAESTTCSRVRQSMYNFLSSVIWAPQKPGFDEGGKTRYCTGKKNTSKHEKKILSGRPCLVKYKMEGKSYFSSCCKLRILLRNPIK